MNLARMVNGETKDPLFRGKSNIPLFPTPNGSKRRTVVSTYTRMSRIKIYMHTEATCRRTTRHALLPFSCYIHKIVGPTLFYSYKNSYGYLRGYTLSIETCEEHKNHIAVEKRYSTTTREVAVNE
jgi:hypothetical protein